MEALEAAEVFHGAFSGPLRLFGAPLGGSPVGRLERAVGDGRMSRCSGPGHRDWAVPRGRPGLAEHVISYRSPRGYATPTDSYSPLPRPRVRR